MRYLGVLKKWTPLLLVLFHEYLPHGYEQNRKHGPGDEAVHAEHGEAAKGREQDEEVRELGVAPHEHRAQDIVRKADDARPVGYEQAALPVMPRGQQVQRRGHPHQSRAHHRDEREQGHHHAPHQRGAYVEQPEYQAAQRALRYGHEQASLHRGAGDGREFAEEQFFPVVAEGQGADEQGAQSAAVAHEEEGNVQHQRKVGEEMRRSAREGDGVLRKEAASLEREAGSS